METCQWKPWALLQVLIIHVPWEVNTEIQFNFTDTPSQNVVYHWNLDIRKNELLLWKSFFIPFKYKNNTNGKAAQYLNNVFINAFRSIWMIVLSIIVTLWIIQMSLADRATKDRAINIKSIVSLLHGPGMRIPVE